MSISATRTIPQEIESLLIFRRRPQVKDSKALSALADNELVSAGPVKTNSSDIAALKTDVAAVKGKIPAAPEEDGTYTLTCTVASGVATYSWEEQE